MTDSSHKQYDWRRRLSRINMTGGGGLVAAALMTSLPPDKNITFTIIVQFYVYFCRIENSSEHVLPRKSMTAKVSLRE